jgi:hypothetical protein
VGEEMQVKDWTGNSKATFVTLGASNHTDKEREVNDYYATEPKALELLLDIEQFDPYVWECVCGEGHLSEVLKKYGYIVKSTDLIDRGYGDGGVDFLQSTEPHNGDIITNPPYKYAQQFVEKALNIIPYGNKVAMFLKLTFLESKGRRALFDNYPPKYIYVASGRLLCAKNGDFDKMQQGGGSAAAYGWFIWEKGYTGEPIVRWFN